MEKDLTTLSPAEIDELRLDAIEPTLSLFDEVGHLFEWLNLFYVHGDSGTAIALSAGGVLGLPDFNGEQPEEMRALATRKREEAKVIENEVNVRFDAEWDRRGGWTRAYLTPDGDIHRSWECKAVAHNYALLPEHSGKTEEEIIAFAREYACAVCYPGAAVEWPSAIERVTGGSYGLHELLNQGWVGEYGLRGSPEALVAEACARGLRARANFDADLGWSVHLLPHTRAESPRRWSTIPS